MSTAVTHGRNNYIIRPNQIAIVAAVNMKSIQAAPAYKLSAVIKSHLTCKINHKSHHYTYILCSAIFGCLGIKVVYVEVKQ